MLVDEQIVGGELEAELPPALFMAHIWKYHRLLMRRKYRHPLIDFLGQIDYLDSHGRGLLLFVVAMR